ncbi:MAG: hypothetical protein R3257_00570, partial [bacterium]|nr:hypothetical protein [bacterium]
ECLEDLDLPTLYAKEKAKWQLRMSLACSPSLTAEEPPTLPTGPDIPDDPDLPEEDFPETGEQGGMEEDSGDPLDTIVVDEAIGEADTGGCSLQTAGGGLANLWILVGLALPWFYFRLRK